MRHVLCLEEFSDIQQQDPANKYKSNYNYTLALFTGLLLSENITLGSSS